ncbi:Trihelix transcription factor ASR3, partial [Cucurbita argyrosperma subsp. sororia]
MKEEDGKRGTEVSGSRRTRSRIAPDWTAADCLVLVNVIAAVEADCWKALSSFQKWKIIAENCTSLDVARNSNQCRRKWDCLLIEHDVIKQWELEMPDDDSYWCLESGRRKELGLPDNFDEEVFKAIDNVVSMRANQSDTEPDSDPEAAVEKVDEAAEPGPKRQRRCSMSTRNQSLEKSVNCEEEDEEPPVSSPEVERRGCYIKSHGEKATDSTEPEEQTMVKKLLETAEKVQAIVSENAEYATSDEKKNDNYNVRTNSIRRQGSKLIKCLEDFLNTINDLHSLLEDQE